MKLIVSTVIFVVCCITLIECTSQRRIDYELPAQISDENKKVFIKQFDEGKALYAMSCGKCHNTTVHRKEIVPDFSAQQLEKYNMKFRNPQHMNTLRDKNVSPEDLQQIFFYLKYKKKNPPAL
jgi:hypothetical protein